MEKMDHFLPHFSYWFLKDGRTKCRIRVSKSVLGPEKTDPDIDKEKPCHVTFRYQKSISQ